MTIIYADLRARLSGGGDLGGGLQDGERHGRQHATARPKADPLRGAPDRKVFAASDGVRTLCRGNIRELQDYDQNTGRVVLPTRSKRYADK